MVRTERSVIQQARELCVEIPGLQFAQGDRRVDGGDLGCHVPQIRAEIVTTALYLASPASSYTTGAMIRVDGGVP